MHIILISYLILIILQQYSRHLLLFNYVTLYVLLNSTLFTINVKIGKEDLTANLVLQKSQSFFFCTSPQLLTHQAVLRVCEVQYFKANPVDGLHNRLKSIFKTSNYPLLKRVHAMACPPARLSRIQLGAYLSALRCIFQLRFLAKLSACLSKYIQRVL